MKNSSDTIGNRTRDLPTSNSVPQPIVPLRAPQLKCVITTKSSAFRPQSLFAVAINRRHFYLRGIRRFLFQMEARTVPCEVRTDCICKCNVD